MVAWSTYADGNGVRWLVAALAAASLAAARAEPEAPRAAVAPNDPLFASQWPLENREHAGGGDVGALEAWTYTRGSPEVLIAVLDDGVELDHPDLAANIASPGRDFGSGAQGADASPRAPQDRHGTAVAGIVAARGDNGIGVTGICPLCRILPIRVEGASTAGLAAAFRYAVEQGADVITNSWGYDPRRRLAADPELRAAIEHAADSGRGGRGTLVVFGVPNDVADYCVGEHADLAALPSVLAVGVSNHRDEVGGSGYGECLDLVAPAKPEKRSTAGVPTTDRSGVDGYTAGAYHTEFGGTSAAAPLVAGIAGLLLALDPELPRAELEAILEQTADKIDASHAAYAASGFSLRAGHGRVNAARAVRAVVERSHALSR
jgi:subtilisin family serine protease